jgi:hypothetical protein
VVPGAVGWCRAIRSRGLDGKLEILGQAPGLADQPRAVVVSRGDHGQCRVDQVGVAVDAGGAAGGLDQSGIDTGAQFLRARAGEGGGLLQFEDRMAQVCGCERVTAGDGCSDFALRRARG